MALPQAQRAMAHLRTVLVKVSPAPATLSERRAVLHILKKRGQVDMFKKLQDPSHFVSIVDTPDMAADLIESSPLEFDYVPQPRSHASPPSPPSPASTASAAATANTTSLSRGKKTFLVKITEHPNYPHKTRIRESPLYGRWPEHDGALWHNDSVPKAVLAKELPRDLARRGLADWESCGQLGDGDDAAVAPWLSRKADYAMARRLKRERTPAWESLMEMYRAAKEARVAAGEEEEDAAAAAQGDGEGLSAEEAPFGTAAEAAADEPTDETRS
ncbi:hypothetical protein VTJ83DRAFT_7272 [Remersonia thermophila]|uniref:Uncharacterized protein n=1 Tax=Remersonia thermophila TaxID=72144 RepID=A0ABR4D389_9PEZI